jgi:hypothetical protein
MVENTMIRTLERVLINFFSDFQLAEINLTGMFIICRCFACMWGLMPLMFAFMSEGS